MTLRPATNADTPALLGLRAALWPDETENALAEDIPGLLTRPDASVFVAETEGRLAGFAEATIRAYSDGCGRGPVAHLEGWYVERAYRRQGVGRALVATVEAWGRVQGCTEIGSDAHVRNHTSRRAHRALGFTETEVLVHFCKPL
ncbi:MAG TPA: aminoglycoside 6'-N-acetyltransferase [Rhodothermales bacterium]|nr:aminoglycoside 6'-N-acetyltransferase [Rhodothermales bacterium]